MHLPLDHIEAKVHGQKIMNLKKNNSRSNKKTKNGKTVKIQQKDYPSNKFKDT